MSRKKKKAQAYNRNNRGFPNRVSTNDGCDLLETCCEEKDIVVSTQRSEVTFDRCGVRHPNGIGYRLTGEKSGSAQYGKIHFEHKLYVQLELVSNGQICVI